MKDQPDTEEERPTTSARERLNTIYIALRGRTGLPDYPPGTRLS